MSRTSVWRHASRPPTIFGVPVMAFLPLFICLFHVRWWTLYLALGCIAFFCILRYMFGLKFVVVWGRFLHFLRGSHIYARPWWYRKRYMGLSPRRRNA